jgi:hypothetical protein
LKKSGCVVGIQAKRRCSFSATDWQRHRMFGDVGEWLNKLECETTEAIGLREVTVAGDFNARIGASTASTLLEMKWALRLTGGYWRKIF